MLFWALLILGGLDRAGILLRFATTHAGIDDALIWSIANDYGHGIFHEPFMYGQNYNLMLEALIGAPFVRFLHPWAVLPVITSLLALLPFWSFAFWCRRHGYATGALIFLLCPLLLPVEWGMLTSMPRGFVGGLALLGILPWTLGLRSIRLRAFVVTFTLSWAALCSPNALIPGGLFYLWLALDHERSWRFWSFSLLGVAPAACFQGYGSTFFATHPWDLMHPMDAGDLSFRFSLMADGLHRLGGHFRQLFPWPAQAGWGMSAALLMPLALLVHQRQWRPAVLLGIAVVLVVLALGITKVHDGCESAFFPLGRMFLGLPLTAAIAWSMALRKVHPGRSGMVAITLVGIAFVDTKAVATPAIIAREMDRQGCAPVAEARITDLRRLATDMADAASRTGADLVVPIRWPGLHVDHAKHFQAFFICYACPLLHPGFPPVLGADFDRRSWLKDRYLNSDVGTVLFVGGDPRMWSTASAIQAEQVPDRLLDLHLVHSNGLSLEQVLDRLGHSR